MKTCGTHALDKHPPDNCVWCLRIRVEELEELWLTEQQARLRQTDLVETYSAEQAEVEIERLRAEVERLITALQRIRDHNVCGD